MIVDLDGSREPGRGLAAAAASPAQVDERRCVGTIGAASIDGDVVVPTGRSCTLVGTRVDGSVKVYNDATLVIRGARINGNVQADNHRAVRIVSRWVDDAERRTRVGGSIQLKSGGGGEIRRAVVNADIQLFANDSRFGVWRNHVGGNLQCKGNRPARSAAEMSSRATGEDQCRTF